MVKFIRSLLNAARRSPSPQKGPSARRNMLYEVDDLYNPLYDEGLRRTGTPDVPPGVYSKRRERFYNLANFYLQTAGTAGHIAECGCWKGLSSFILCGYERKLRPGFQGEQYLIFDSFEGLSRPGAEDAIRLDEHGEVVATAAAGAYVAQMEHVQEVLSGYPKVSYFKGWIPSRFAEAPEGPYRFVHLDLDLYQPIRDCLLYFYPRLAAGGMIISDDYGHLNWPGAKKAIDDFCAENNIPLLSISTGQAIIWKR